MRFTVCCTGPFVLHSALCTGVMEYERQAHDARKAHSEPSVFCGCPHFDFIMKMALDVLLHFRRLENTDISIPFFTVHHASSNGFVPIQSVFVSTISSSSSPATLPGQPTTTSTTQPLRKLHNPHSRNPTRPRPVARCDRVECIGSPLSLGSTPASVRQLGRLPGVV